MEERRKRLTVEVIFTERFKKDIEYNYYVNYHINKSGTTGATIALKMQTVSAQLLRQCRNN